MDELKKCWSCGMPDSGVWGQSLHLEDCIEHDPETCKACEKLKEDDDDDEQDRN